MNVGRNQHRPGRNLAEGCGVNKFLVGQPMMRINYFSFNQWDHYKAAAKVIDPMRRKNG